MMGFQTQKTLLPPFSTSEILVNHFYNKLKIDCPEILHQYFCLCIIGKQNREGERNRNKKKDMYKYKETIQMSNDKNKNVC